MRELVPLALHLVKLAEGVPEALVLTDGLAVSGWTAFAQLGVHGDTALILRKKAEQVGLLTTDGRADRTTLARLVLVLDILSLVPETSAAPPTPEPLVFTVPQAAQQLVKPAQRLDILVNDVIARAESTLHIGGPFWNEGGWALLRPVVLPALKHRHVVATFYLHPHESGKLEVVESMLAEARLAGEVRALWWAGSVPSLMHAKFVVADSGRGYFGSANLTTLGLSEHLEMGVALEPQQSSALLRLVSALEAAGLFTDAALDH
jgi:hypothetical protein